MNLQHLLIVMIMAIQAPTAAAPHAGDMPVLTDQFGEPVSLTTATGQAQIAIVVSAKRLRRIKPWEKALRQEFPDLMLVRIADIPRNSPTEYEKVAEKLRKRLPEDISVGIDLDGQWSAALELDTQVPNILLFDAAGILTYRQSGMYKKSRYPLLQAALIEAQVPTSAAAATDEKDDAGALHAMTDKTGLGRF